MAARAISAVDQRDSGVPDWAGSSHASALTSAICAGGKTPRPPGPWSVLKPLDALAAEPFSPLRHRLTRLIQPLGDLLVGHALGGVENRLGPDHVAIRTRIRRGATLQLGPLLIAQDHLVWRAARHHQQDSPPRRTLLQRSAA